MKAPRGTFYSGSTKYTADLKLMEYRYDEWGNRRAIYVNYNAGGSSRAETDWFDYDNEGRVTVDSGFISGGRVVVGKSGGTAITYDNDGRRATTEKWQGTTNGHYTGGYGGSGGTYVPGYERFQQERFTYNDLGALATAQKRTVRRDTGDNSGDSYYSPTSYTTYETNTYDNRGFKTRSIYNGNRTDNTYNAGGLVTYSATYDSQGRRTGITDSYQYDRMGMLRGYRFRYYDKGTYKFQNTYSYENNATFSSYQNTRITLNSTQGSTEEGVTNNSYDYRGRLVQSTITQRYKNENKTGLTYRYFIYDTDGQIIASRERHAGESSYDVQSYFYQGANSLANFGDLGAHYNPISSIHKGGNSATSYSVNEGDTLSSIAQMIYGDASLWYVIAEANGLSMSPVDRFGSTDAGRSLRIPNSDQSIKNNSTTFKPYSPGEIIGDLTPDAKIVPPPPPKKGGCNKLAMIVMVVVAVVVTVVTAGAAAAAIAAAAPALAGTAATMAGAFIGGVVGSLASQATGMVLGVTDGFDLRQAFASGLTGAFTAGIGSALSSSTSTLIAEGGKLTTLGHALQGAGSVAAGAVANKIAGLDSGFSWRAVAAGAVAGAITGSLGLNDSNSKTGNVKPGKFLSAFGKSFASSAIEGVVNRAFSKGQKKSYGDIAFDAFGNALGSGLAAHFELRQKAEEFGDKLGRKMAGKAQQADVDALNASMQSAMSRMNKELEEQNNQRVNKAVDNALAETNDAISAQQSAKLEDTVNTKLESDRQAKSAERIASGLKDAQETSEYLDGLENKSAERDKQLADHVNSLARDEQVSPEEAAAQAHREKVARMVEKAKAKQAANAGKPKMHASGMTAAEWDARKAAEQNGTLRYDLPEEQIPENFYDRFVGAWELGKEQRLQALDDAAIADGGGAVTMAAAFVRFPAEFGFGLLDAGLALGGLFASPRARQQSWNQLTQTYDDLVDIKHFAVGEVATDIFSGEDDLRFAIDSDIKTINGKVVLGTDFWGTQYKNVNTTTGAKTSVGNFGTDEVYRVAQDWDGNPVNHFILEKTSKAVSLVPKSWSKRLDIKLEAGIRHNVSTSETRSALNFKVKTPIIDFGIEWRGQRHDFGQYNQSLNTNTDDSN